MKVRARQLLALAGLLAAPLAGQEVSEGEICSDLVRFGLFTECAGAEGKT